MRTLWLSIVVLAGCPGGQSSQDSAVYRAVLAHTIAPEARKYSAYWKVDPSAAPIIATLTVGMCSAQPPSGVGCVRDESFRVFEGTHPSASSLPFAGLIDAGTRRRLAGEFRTRNAVSVPFSGDGLGELKLLTPPELRQFDARKWAAPGFSTFSLPVYAGRHALVYASFTCGGLCGYGWLVLLEQHEDGWRVLGNHMMWIS